MTMAGQPNEKEEPMSGIENTAKAHEGDMLLARATGKPAGLVVPEGSIEAMEAEGQRQLVESDVLPWEGTHLYADLGIEVIQQVEGDPLFCTVKLPEGWRKEASDHDMWSYVVDVHGKRRLAVFYKAAFYDRRASARLES